MYLILKLCWNYNLYLCGLINGTIHLLEEGCVGIGNGDYKKYNHILLYIIINDRQ